MLWQTSLSDRLFFDFGCLISATHLNFILFHTTFLLICQALSRRSDRLLIQKKIFLYFSLLSDLAKFFLSTLSWRWYSTIQKSFRLLALKSLLVE